MRIDHVRTRRLGEGSGQVGTMVETKSMRYKKINGGVVGRQREGKLRSGSEDGKVGLVDALWFAPWPNEGERALAPWSSHGGK